VAPSPPPLPPLPPPPPPPPPLPAPAASAPDVPRLKQRPPADNDYGGNDYAPEAALPPAPVRSTTAASGQGDVAGIDC
jgi:hypothetical protein